MRAKNKSTKKMNSVKRTNNRDVESEKSTARDEIKITGIEVIKKDNEVNERQQRHNNAVFKDIKNNDKREVSPAEQYVKLNVEKNARKKRNPVELQSSDDNFDEESPNSKLNSQVKSNEKPEPSIENEKVSTNRYKTRSGVETSSESELTSEDVSNSDEEDWASIRHNKNFVPAIVYTTDESEDDSYEDKEVVPVSVKAKGPDKEEQMLVAKPMCNMEKFWEKENDNNNDKIPTEDDNDSGPCEEQLIFFNYNQASHINDLTGKRHISRACSHEKDDTAASAEKPTSKTEVSDSYVKSADNDGSKQGLRKHCTKKSGGFSETICFKCDETGHMFRECPKQKSFEGGTRCFKCSKIGHKTKECPMQKSFQGGRKCYNCNDIGHMSKECPKQKSFKGSMRCYNCDEMGHMSKECPKQTSFEGGTICYNCKAIGHMSRECPKQKSFEVGTRCFKCSKIGHVSRECQMTKSFEGGIKCYNCNEIGHMFRECPKQKSFEDATKCYNCNEIGHMSRECPQRKSFEGGTKCYNCNEIGHMYRECRNQKSFKDGTRCYNCNKIGHMFRECSKQKSDGGLSYYIMTGIMPRDGRAKVDYSSIDHLKANDIKCSVCQKIGHSLEDCPEKRNSSYIKLSLSDQYEDWNDQHQIDFSTEKRYVSRYYPQVEEKAVLTIPSDKHTFRGSRLESESKNDFGFKVKKDVKRFYNSTFNNDSEPCKKKYKHVGHCFICDQPGHISNDCPTKNFGGGNLMLCFNCNKIGHLSRECPMKKTSQATHVCCNYDETGLMLRKCQTKTFSESVVKCYNCNGIGHTYVECPSKVGVRGLVRGDDLRHISDNKCNEVCNRHLPMNMKCFHCHGHSKTDCHDEPKHIDCFNFKKCNISRNCPQTEKSVGGARFGRGSITYGYGKDKRFC